MKQIITGKKTLLMGILNVTPDSFSDGGLYTTAEKAVKRVREMLDEGADIIDIGGESTRPGSKTISEQEELKRIMPVLKAVRNKFGNKFLISVDTYKAKVADEALTEGADLLNSMGGFKFEPGLTNVVKKFNCKMVIYHINGTPETMQEKLISKTDVILEIVSFFKEQIQYGVDHALSRDQFLLDPGIGFGKTVEKNIDIIRKLNKFKKFGLPLVVGVSRKSHLEAILKQELNLSSVAPADRLEAALAETAVAVLNGAAIVRTHDVLQTKKFLAVLDEIKNL